MYSVAKKQDRVTNRNPQIVDRQSYEPRKPGSLGLRYIVGRLFMLSHRSMTCVLLRSRTSRTWACESEYVIDSFCPACASVSRSSFGWATAELFDICCTR